MDKRYDMLKLAMCRNIKEYNVKFKERRLNPNDGHGFLPYIVLVIDEFADLIMTAGKEVETPIARLAQLARAVGIHLIIATQRPSVNVITGLIKANFPARIAFRVTSKVDSRTILDSGGADQLIGRGDMLFTQGNNLIRLQCAFVDTPEVDKIADFIGSPAINLMKGTATENQSIKIKDQLLPHIKNNLTAGQEIVYGIRPTDIKIVADSKIKAEVVLVETTGSETHIISMLDGHEFRIVQPGGRTEIKSGDHICLDFDLTKAHTFDQLTTKRVD